MMTPEIEKQLIKWGGILSMSPLFWIRFELQTCAGLYIYRDGDIKFCNIELAPWKTIDDIMKVLDVFGVKRKETPKWTIHHADVIGPDKQTVYFWRHGNPDLQAATEYAAWKNSQE